MYKLFQRLPNSATCGLQPISQIVRDHIVDVRIISMCADVFGNLNLLFQVGMSLVRKEEAEKDHTNYAQQLIDLHDQ
jgi:hypothetical protein